MFYADGVPAGSFGCWRTGFVQTWSAKPRHEMTVTQRMDLAQRIEAVRRQREADKRQRHADAAAAAAIRWAAATPASDAHPYLLRKGVRAHGLRVDAAGNLLVPMRDTVEYLHSLQEIHPDGFKHFMIGGRVKGC